MEECMSDLTYANPPTRCDLCGTLIIDEFIDALIPRYGKWGNIDPACAVGNGVQFGTGLGQRYQLKADGLFHKVEG